MPRKHPKQKAVPPAIISPAVASERVMGIPPDLVRHDDVIALADKLPTLWGMDFMKIQELHKRGYTGKGVVIAINDTGYKAHPFLPKPIFTIDMTRSSGGVTDRNGHGSHCAGTALGRFDDSGYSLGVAPDADYIAVKVLGDNGSGSTSGINKGRIEAAKAGAHIISESLGDGGGPPIAEDIDAFNKAYDEGARICVAALGNAGRAGVGRPGSYKENAGIAAIREDGKRADFSSIGDPADLATPGQNIISCGLNNNLVKMSGTCVAEGEFVYTPDGPVPIQEIVAGDTVYAYADGKRVERIVSQVWNRGTNNVLRLSAMGRSVIVTETHEMLCVDKTQKDLDWVRAKDIDPERHRLVVPKELPANVNPYLDSVVSVEFAYLLGYVIGDGWLSHTTGGKRVCVAEDGKEQVREKVLKMYQDFTNRSMKLAKNGRWYYDDSTRISLLFEAAGLNGKSYSKTLPFWVWHLSHPKQDAILQGYFDADGNTRALDRKVALECVSHDLVSKIAALSDYRGWKRGMTRSRHRNTVAPNQVNGCRRTHSLNLNPHKFIATNGGQVFGKAKDLDARMMAMGLDPSHFATGSVRIDDVSETANVYDLTVPRADNFVTGGLVTHNSMATPFCAGLFALIIQYMQENGYPALKGWKAWREFFSDPRFTIDAGTPGKDREYGYGIPQVNKIIDWMLEPKHV